MGFGRNKGVNDDKTEARRSSRVTMCDMVKTVSRLVRAASGFSKDDLRSRDWCDFRNAPGAHSPRDVLLNARYIITSTSILVPNLVSCVLTPFRESAGRLLLHPVPS